MQEASCLLSVDQTWIFVLRLETGHELSGEELSFLCDIEYHQHRRMVGKGAKEVI
jgi:hypothetical protein